MKNKKWLLGILILTLIVGAIFFKNSINPYQKGALILLRNRNVTKNKPLTNAVQPKQLIFTDETYTITQTLRLVACSIQWNKTYTLPNKATQQAELTKVTNFFKKSSYGKVQINTELYQVQWNGPLPKTVQEDSEFAAQACDPFVDFSTVDIFVVFPKVNSWGAGNSSKTELKTQEGIKSVFNVSVGHYDAQSGFINHFSDAILNHEILHNVFGDLPHANGIECGQKMFSNTPGECESVEYGNPFDALGGGTIIGDLNSFYKYLIKWLPPWLVTQDGTYQLWALETTTSKYAHIIRIPYEKNPLCLEYRKPIGLDTSLSTDKLSKSIYDGVGGIDPKGCIFIQTCSAYDVNKNANIQKYHSDLVDTTPESRVGPASAYDFYDSCLKPNTKFSNADLGLSISSFNPAMNGDYANITIDIDEGRSFAKTPNITILGSRGYPNSCSIGGKIDFGLQNTSEVDMNSDFSINLYGFKNGQRTLIDQQTIPGLRAGMYVDVKYDYQKYFGYGNLIMSADETNKIAETTKLDNENSYSPGCI